MGAISPSKMSRDRRGLEKSVANVVLNNKIMNKNHNNELICFILHLQYFFSAFFKTSRVARTFLTNTAQFWRIFSNHAQFPRTSNSQITHNENHWNLLKNTLGSPFYVIFMPQFFRIFWSVTFLKKFKQKNLKFLCFTRNSVSVAPHWKIFKKCPGQLF